MKTARTLFSVLLFLAATSPARADFKYQETSQITGGVLVKVTKVASFFARGDAKKQEQQAFQPSVTTHYVKGNRLRIDNPDGTVQIIDLDGRRVISINTNQKTYAVATFDQIKAAMEQAVQQAAVAQQQTAAQQPSQPQNAQVTITPTMKVTPGAGNRIILDQPTNETKVEIDIVMQATATSPDGSNNAAPPGQPNSGTATYAMNMDTFVAPGVAGYQEFGQFYRRMAQQVNWMTLPSNIHVDPRVSQGLSSLQQNSDALKGLPMLSYVSMTIAAANVSGQTQTASSQNNAQNQSQSAPQPSASKTSDDSTPTTASDAIAKGIGKGFGKVFSKKNNQDNQAAGSTQAGAAPPPNPSSDPNALIEITTQVNSFSSDSLDASTFDIPAGYMQLQMDPTLVMAGGVAAQKQTPTTPGR